MITARNSRFWAVTLVAVSFFLTSTSRFFVSAQQRNAVEERVRTPLVELEQGGPHPKRRFLGKSGKSRSSYRYGNRRGYNRQRPSLYYTNVQTTYTSWNTRNNIFRGNNNQRQKSSESTGWSWFWNGQSSGKSAMGKSASAGKSRSFGKSAGKKSRKRRRRTPPPITRPPTRLPTTAPTPLPTAAPTTRQPTTNIPSLSPTTATPGTTTNAPTTSTPTTVAPTSCEAADYNVNLDLQIQYVDDEFAACVDDEDNQIALAISNALNAGFPTVVTNWDGTAEFGEFVFDIDQEVDNVGNPFGRRGLVLRAATPRGLQIGGGECPERSLECTADVADRCRWGCVTAATTNCAEEALFDQWPNLAANVLQAALVTLGFDCLGIADELNVELIVDTTPLPAATSRSGNFDAFTADMYRTADNKEEKTDVSTINFSVQSIIFFTFFDGEGQEPTPAEMDALVEETKKFFTNVFENDPSFAKDFIEFQMTDLVPKYNDEEASDQFELDFKSTVVLKDTVADTITSSKQVAEVMGESDYKEYITDYVWSSEPFNRNEFYNTLAVQFDAWAINP